MLGFELRISRVASDHSTTLYQLRYHTALDYLKFANVGIRTTDLWCRKRTLYQLCHHDWPRLLRIKWDLFFSLFETVRVAINDVPITLSASDYPYRAYLSTTLTYGPLVKNAQLACQGYYADVHDFMETEASNSGFTQRNNLMRVGNKSTGAYSPEGTRFFGRLLMDLSSCESGLPPGTKVSITLEKSASEFCLMKKSDDTEKYQVKFLDVNLYVPVAQLSQPTFNEISTLFATKSIGLHYRRVEIRTISLPRNKQEFFSDNLFNEGQHLTSLKIPHLLYRISYRIKTLLMALDLRQC